MNKQSKEALVAEFAQKLKEAKAAFLADYRGLDVDQANDLRNKLREVGVEYRVVKNTLLRLAAKDTDAACFAEFLIGPTATAPTYAGGGCGRGQGVVGSAESRTAAGQDAGLDECPGDQLCRRPGCSATFVRTGSGSDQGPEGSSLSLLWLTSN